MWLFCKFKFRTLHYSASRPQKLEKRPIFFIRALWSERHQDLVRAKQDSKILFPKTCAAWITAGRTLQSTKNCILKKSLFSLRKSKSTRFLITGLSEQKSFMNSNSRLRSSIRDSHWRRTCSNVSDFFRFKQESSKQKPSLFLLQNLHNRSVL